MPKVNDIAKWAARSSTDPIMGKLAQREYMLGTPGRGLQEPKLPGLIRAAEQSAAMLGMVPRLQEPKLPGLIRAAEQSAAMLGMVPRLQEPKLPRPWGKLARHEDMFALPRRAFVSPDPYAFVGVIAESSAMLDMARRAMPESLLAALEEVIDHRLPVGARESTIATLADTLTPSAEPGVSAADTWLKVVDALSRAYRTAHRAGDLIVDNVWAKLILLGLGLYNVVRLFM